jgi:exoribonuclease-2
VAPLQQGSLVLYKNRPARVARVGDKLGIELEGGKTLSVRRKDVVLLHPGPMQGLDELRPQAGEVEAAWELLAGDTTTLDELAELIYGAYTPVAAWAAWQLVDDGLYFQGTPEEVVARSAEAVAQERAARQAQAAERRAWATFMERARAGEVALGTPEDEGSDVRYLQEVEELALGRRDTSRVLRELGRGVSPENAHALLLELGYWDQWVDPYPRRLKLLTSPPAVTLAALPDEERVDLTHLPAFAIDDEGNRDPDDALSLEKRSETGQQADWEGWRLWVHVADVGALVHPDSPADLEARARGATLYLPEGAVPMLPPEAVRALGLGLVEVSPALSYGLDLDSAGAVLGVEVVPSWVRVTRLTYEEAEARIESGEAPFQNLYQLAQSYHAHRHERGAVHIELPEVKISVRDGDIDILPLFPLKSRALVREAMLMAGEAVGRFALERDIPFPFTTQPAPQKSPSEAGVGPGGLAGMYALRRTLKRSQYRSVPVPHAGLGLEIYAQATSPLRRYLDLVVHQQLRAHLRGGRLLKVQEVLERVGAAMAVAGDVRRAERLARRHWTLVYLVLQFEEHSAWQGEGVLVEKHGSRGTVLVPDLALEVRAHLREDLPLNSSVSLALGGVDLANLDAYFRIAVH